MSAVLELSEAEEMEKLGGEKSNKAEFRGVVKSEDDVGDTGGEHGGEEEVVAREGFGDVEETKGDATNTE